MADGKGWYTEALGTVVLDSNVCFPDSSVSYICQLLSQVSGVSWRRITNLLHSMVSELNLRTVVLTWS